MPRHVVVLMPDQWRADCLSALNHPVVKTPHVDALLAQSLRFDRAYTMCPICMPARSSFLSGQYVHNHGQWSNYGQLPPTTDTYARRLQSAGYRTAHIGKSHLYEHARGDHLEKHKPFLNALGFEDVLEVTGPLATRFTNSIMTDHWAKLGCLKTFRDDYARRAEAAVNALWPSPMPPGETLDDFVGRTAVDYIDHYNDARPMMLFVGFGGPHDPWDPPKDWAAKYENIPIDPPKPITDAPAWLPPAAAEHHRRMQHPHPGFTPEVAAKTRALYYAKISHIDDWIGKIVDSLKRKNMWNDTTVIFWSDHGEMLWDKQRLHKAVFFEESVRVPLAIRTPETAASPPGATQSLVSLMDVFPTILDLAGCEPRKDKDAFGKSLAPLLANPQLQVNDAVFSEIAESSKYIGPPRRRPPNHDPHRPPQAATRRSRQPPHALRPRR